MSSDYIQIANTSEEVQKILKSGGIVDQNKQTNEDQETRIEKLEDQHLDKTYIPLSEKDNLATKEQLNNEVIKLNNKIDTLPPVGVGREGEGAGAEIFNDYDNNVAEGDFATAKGKNTRAGAKCFKLDTNYEYTYIETREGFYAVPYKNDGITQEMIDAWEEAINSEQGLRYTIVLKGSYDLQGKVVSHWQLSEDKGQWGFYVTNFVTPSTDPNSSAYLNENSYIFFPDYPWIGIDTIGTGASSEGYGTQALEVAAHSEGYNTKAIGQYAHTEGVDTIATYQGHAEGTETAALKANSHAQGLRGAVTGIGGHIEGLSDNRAIDHIFDEQGKIKSRTELVKAYNSTPFSLSGGEGAHVEGKNNLGLGFCQHIEGFGNIGIGNYSHVQGRYAEIDYDGRYIEIVGNGTRISRKNIRTLDTEGNGWYAKDVYIKGKTSKDTALTLNKEVPAGGYNHKKDFASKFTPTDSNSIPTDVVGNQYVSGQKVICTAEGSGEITQTIYPDGTMEISNISTTNDARYKFFDFLTSKEKLTQDDIGKKFLISIRCKYNEGNVRLGLMGRGAVNNSLFYDTQGVITFNNHAWTIINREITIDEFMVENQIGLITLDFSKPDTDGSAAGSIIIDYIESAEIKTVEKVINNKVDKEYVDEIMKNDAQLLSLKYSTEVQNNQDLDTLSDEYKFKGAIVSIADFQHLYYYTGSEWIWCGSYSSNGSFYIYTYEIIPEHFGQVLRLEYPEKYGEEKRIIEYYQHYESIYVPSDDETYYNYVKLIVADDLNQYATKELVTEQINNVDRPLIIDNQITEPTSDTPGKVGQFYFSTNGDNALLWLCTDISNDGKTSWCKILTLPDVGYTLAPYYDTKYGISADELGSVLKIAKATNEEIDIKTNEYKPIVPSNLNYAVDSAIKDLPINSLINNQPSKKVKGAPSAVCENSLGYLRSIAIDGNSTQDGTPTYDSPKDITDYSNGTLIIKNSDETLSQSVALPYVLRNVKGYDGTTVKNSDSITVDYNKGKVYFNQNIGVYTYTKADEARVSAYTVTGGSARVAIASALENNVSDTTSSAKNGATSNYGIQCGFSASTNNIGLLANGRNIFIRQPMENFADLQAFKTWLNSGVDNNKPLVVYYSLANPVVTDISDTDCGKALLALKVYKDKFTLATEGTTNETEYIVTIDSALNELKQAIITLGGNE